MEQEEIEKLRIEVIKIFDLNNNPNLIKIRNMLQEHIEKMTRKINKKLNNNGKSNKLMYFISQLLKGVVITAAGMDDKISILEFDTPQEYTEKYGVKMSQHLIDCINLLNRIKTMYDIQLNGRDCAQEVIEGIKDNNENLLRVAKIVYDYYKQGRKKSGNNFLKSAMKEVGAQGKLRVDLQKKENCSFDGYFDKYIDGAISNNREIFEKAVTMSYGKRR